MWNTYNHYRLILNVDLSKQSERKPLFIQFPMSNGKSLVLILQRLLLIAEVCCNSRLNGEKVARKKSISPIMRQNSCS